MNFFQYVALISTLTFSLSAAPSGGAQPVKGGRLHEAFMTLEAPVTLLQAVEEQPPHPLKEDLPKQTLEDTVWVPGYWEWSSTREAFIWCSGGWRRPPPQHQWIPGYWKQFDEGWVRLKGFWSPEPVDNLTYISKPPPPSYNENPANPPSKDSFWMAGYWKYVGGEYTWYSGKWEKADPNWIYSPARYVWRPQGYVFLPAFWDWPLEERGVAHACLMISELQEQITYTPDLILEPSVIIQECLLYYPDYTYFYLYYYLFDPGWWVGCNWCPPWWGWNWWWFGWGDQWALWWWWTHPGFPFPFWFPVNALDALFGPPLPLVKAMGGVHPPLIVTPDGVVPFDDLIDALGGDAPIFPEDASSIQEEAGKDTPQGGDERPRGPRVPRGELQKEPEPPPIVPPFPPPGAEVGEQPSRPEGERVVPTPPKPEPSRPPITQPQGPRPRPTPRPKPTPRPSPPPQTEQRPTPPPQNWQRPTPPPRPRPRPSTPPQTWQRPSQPPQQRPGPSQPPQQRPGPSRPPQQRPRPSTPPQTWQKPSRPAQPQPQPSRPEVTPSQPPQSSPRGGSGFY